VGSYVDRTTEQLRQTLSLDGVVALELAVDRVLDVGQRREEIATAQRAASRALADGRDVVLYTSRERSTRHGQAGDLGLGARISSALVEVVAGIDAAPSYIVAKGGITSSDIATQALGVQRGWVLGQVLPGVPVWRLGPESRFPGAAYVVFPGNVGDGGSLRRVLEELRG